MDDLLPQYAKGDGFAGFPLAGYFDYAELWLNTAEQNRQQQARLEKLNLPTGHSAKLPPMPIDILAYGLTTAGEIDYQRITDLFCVIAILWGDGDPTPPIANLLHPLWQSNDYRPHEIAAILMFTSRAQENGGLVENRGFQFAAIMLNAYREMKGFPKSHELSRGDMDDLLKLWAGWTRRNPTSISDQDCHRDYLDLGIIRYDSYDADQIRRILRFVLTQTGDPSFAATRTFLKPFLEARDKTEQTKVNSALKTQQRERERKKIG